MPTGAWEGLLCAAEVEVRPTASLSEAIPLFEQPWCHISSPNLLGLDFSGLGKFLTFMIHFKRFVLYLRQNKSDSVLLEHREEVSLDMFIEDQSLALKYYSMVKNSFLNQTICVLHKL